jgi:hypothetical protein
MVAADPARHLEKCKTHTDRPRLRAFADGFASVLLPVHLLELGFGVIAISSIVTARLIGSALLTALGRHLLASA